jgi:hypothetical protein
MARKVIISRLAKPNIDGPQSCGVDERAEATMSESAPRVWVFYFCATELV